MIFLPLMNALKEGEMPIHVGGMIMVNFKGGR